MKNYIKNSSRISLVIVLSLLLVVGQIVIVSAETATKAETGYNTVNSTVYSPLDLFDGTTLMAGNTSVTPTFENGSYDSSVWKFASTIESFFTVKKAEISGITVKSVYGGVKLSWDDIGDNYTVKLSNGANDTKYFTTGNSMLFENLTAGENYMIQVVADSGKVSDIISFANNKAAVKLTHETIANGVRNHDVLAYFDNNAKSFLDANGALVLKMKTTIETEMNTEITVSMGDDSLTVNANDCYISTNTFIYPTDSQGETYTTTSSEFYSNSGDKHNVFLDGSGNWVANAAQGYRGVHERLYRTNAIGFTDGYVIIPLDDFDVTVDGETVKYNLIDITKASGVLTVANVINNYCYSPDGTNVYYNAVKKLTDREITYTEMYIVKDFAEAGLAAADYADLDYTVYTADKANVEQVSAHNIMTDTAYVKGAKHASLKSHMMLSAANASSFYNFYCTTNNYTANTLEYTRRSIEFTVGSEAMAFGYTAQAAGTYEISAPLSVTGTNVKYSVYKTDASGNKTVLQAEQTYTSQETFCCLQVKLEAGDTVWLYANGDEGAVINIGVPEARLINTATDTTFTYLASDYFEDTNSNGITYATGSATANTKGAWDFGYFKYTTDMGTTLSAFKNPSINYLKTAAEDTELSNDLLAAMTPHEIIRGGNYYNAIDVTADSIAASATSGPGVMFHSNTDLSSAGTVSLGFHDLTAAATGATAYGHYFTFTSAVSGNANLTLGGKVALANQVYMIIAVNNVAKVVTYATTADDYAYNVRVEAGDTVTVLMYSFKVAKKSFDITAPQVTITNAYNSVKYDAAGGNTDAVNNDFAVQGSEITLPTAEKAGCRFNGWIVNGADTVTAANATVTVAEDMTIVADYDCYGDLDGDDLVNDADIGVLRTHILKSTALGDRAELAEFGGDQTLDILDLLMLIRLSNGIAL